MSKLKRTPLMIACTCSKCNATYFATMVYGGIAIDEEQTDTIADAYLKGDKVELLDSKSVKMAECSCS